MPGPSFPSGGTSLTTACQSTPNRLPGSCLFDCMGWRAAEAGRATNARTRRTRSLRDQVVRGITVPSGELPGPPLHWEGGASCWLSASERGQSGRQPEETAGGGPALTPWVVLGPFRDRSPLASFGVEKEGFCPDVGDGLELLSNRPNG